MEALSPSLLFAVAGMAATDRSLPADIYYDAIELARQASQTFQFDPSWMQKNQTVREIAEKWAWDVAFRIRRGVRDGWYQPLGSTWVTGVFVGLEPNGEVSAAIANLEYHKPRPGMIVPPVSISISVPVPPKDFTWIDAFGYKDVADSYSSNTRLQTRQERNTYAFASNSSPTHAVSRR